MYNCHIIKLIGNIYNACYKIVDRSNNVKYDYSNPILVM